MNTYKSDNVQPLTGGGDTRLGVRSFGAVIALPWLRSVWRNGSPDSDGPLLPGVLGGVDSTGELVTDGDSAGRWGYSGVKTGGRCWVDPPAVGSSLYGLLLRLESPSSSGWLSGLAMMKILRNFDAVDRESSPMASASTRSNSAGAVWLAEGRAGWRRHYQSP